MRTISFLIGVFLFIITALPVEGQIQVRIKEIWQKLDTATGKSRFKLLNDLAWEYRFANPDSAIIFSRDAFSFGTSIKIEKDLARALNISGIASNYRGNKIIAYKYYVQALEVSKKQSDSIEIAYTYNNLGRIFLEQGMMNKAFPNITMASEIFAKIGDSTGLAYCYQSLGNLYQAQHNYEKATENYLLGLAIRLRLHNQRNIHGGFHLLGRLYAEQRNVDEAMKYLLKADSVGRSQDDAIQLAETWVYLSKSYLEKGMISKADSLLSASLLIIRTKKSVRILSNALLIGAEIAMKKGNMSKGKSLLDEALVNGKKVGDRSVTRDVYFQLWKLYERNNDRLGMLYNQNQYLLIQDTLKSLDVSRQADELKFEREIIVQEAENQKLKLENSAIEQQQRSQAYMFGYIVLLIVVVALILWLNLRKTKSISLQLSKKNEMLIQINEEKDSLMSIVAHDLKSPLNKVQGLSSLLKMDGELSEDQTTYVQLMDRVVQDSLSFISDLLSVHALEEHRIPEISEFNAADVVREKINAACGVAKNKKIIFSEFLQSVNVRSDKEYLGRITDNLISNAIKFSPEHSEVIVSVEQYGDQFLLAIEDKGPGFTDQDKKLVFQKFRKLSARPTAGESSNGLGLAIVKTLVDRLGGTIVLESERGRGTKFVVGFPLSAPVLTTLIPEHFEYQLG